MYDSMLVSPQAKSKGEINVIRKMLRLEEEEEKGVYTILTSYYIRNFSPNRR
jgi:hypothetical protein